MIIDNDEYRSVSFSLYIVLVLPEAAKTVAKINRLPRAFIHFLISVYRVIYRFPTNTRIIYNNITAEGRRSE